MRAARAGGDEELFSLIDRRENSATMPLRTPRDELQNGLPYQTASCLPDDQALRTASV